MFKFITRKPLWMNILFSVVVVTVALLLFLFSLNFITRHGKTLVIPAVTGKSLTEAQRVLAAQGFEVVIQDSIYSDTARAQAVMRQFPEAEEVVKENRTVYLTINRSVPPSIEMPMLEGLSYRNAEIVLKQYGLLMGDTSYRPDYAKNSVLEQRLHNGDRLKAGTKIQMGSSIDLILGSGVGQDEFAVPDVYGMIYAEARILLEQNGLNVMVIPDADVSDTANAYVYQQRPNPQTPDGRVNHIRIGQQFDLFLSSSKPPARTEVPEDN